MLPGNVPTIDVSEIAADAVVLDVREDHEWTAGHIEGARHIPMFQVPQHAGRSDDLSPDVPIAVVCKAGGRSAQVTAWLNQHGYQARNVDGGMLAWAASGRPMVSEDGAPPRVA
jgi:rhodanese-related sulfurtransferase